jgi:hypothetical protein
MAALTAVMVFEKTGQGGRRGVRPIGVGVLVLGLLMLAGAAAGSPTAWMAAADSVDDASTCTGKIRISWLRPMASTSREARDRAMSKALPLNA